MCVCVGGGGGGGVIMELVEYVHMYVFSPWRSQSDSSHTPVDGMLGRLGKAALRSVGDVPKMPGLKGGGRGRGGGGGTEGGGGEGGSTGGGGEGKRRIYF